MASGPRLVGNLEVGGAGGDLAVMGERRQVARLLDGALDSLVGEEARQDAASLSSSCSRQSRAKAWNASVPGSATR
jgi:hypothetical protein